jgi:SAM-dependent methyltransferase
MQIATPQTFRCASLGEFEAFLKSPESRAQEIETFEIALLCAETFTVSAHCAVCDQDVGFLVDYVHCFEEPDGRRFPNFRERLICPVCGLNNRLRACASFVLAAAEPGHVIYLTECATPLFDCVASRHQPTIGSAYLRDGTPRGKINRKGVRHEDVTDLTLADASVDVIGSFDVLEHVPTFRKALAEFFRCLRPGETLVLTVPLDLEVATTVTRATVDASGAVTHLLPPEIHGDPMDESGALCFHNFGWDFIDAMRDTGFDQADIVLFWDPRLGYLGGYQYVLNTCKPSGSAASRTTPTAPWITRVLSRLGLKRHHARRQRQSV